MRSDAHPHPAPQQTPPVAPRGCRVPEPGTLYAAIPSSPSARSILVAPRGSTAAPSRRQQPAPSLTFPFFSPCRGRRRVHDGVRPSRPLPGGEFVQAHPQPPGMGLDQAGGSLRGTGTARGPGGRAGEEGQQLGSPRFSLLDPPGKLKGDMPTPGACPRAARMATRASQCIAGGSVPGPTKLSFFASPGLRAPFAHSKPWNCF